MAHQRHPGAKRPLQRKPAGLFRELCSALHQLNRDLEVQVLEFLEPDATATDGHLAKATFVSLGEVAVVVAGAKVEAEVVLLARETDDRTVPLAAAIVVSRK